METTSLGGFERSHQHRIKAEPVDDMDDLYDATPQPVIPPPAALPRRSVSLLTSPGTIIALRDEPELGSPIVMAPNAIHEPVAVPQLRQPLAIRRLPSIRSSLQFPENAVTFSWKDLQKNLKGLSVTPCKFHSANPASLANDYIAVNRQHEPYLPAAPGEHGAKLSCFMVAVDDEPDNVPLFVGELSEGNVKYTYFGTYRTPRWSDLLDYDRMVEQVPRSVKKWHATELSRPCRPAWLHTAMKEHFWPLPRINEIPPELQAQVVEAHDKEAEEWMESVTAVMIMEYFEAPDFGGDRYTLRLAWEYLECTGYDQGLYDKLVDALNVQNQE